MQEVRSRPGRCCGNCQNLPDVKTVPTDQLEHEESCSRQRYPSIEAPCPPSPASSFCIRLSCLVKKEARTTSREKQCVVGQKGINMGTHEIIYCFCIIESDFSGARVGGFLTSFVYAAPEFTLTRYRLSQQYATMPPANTIENHIQVTLVLRWTPFELLELS
jgi:hypothetical protein